MSHLDATHESACTSSLFRPRCDGGVKCTEMVAGPEQSVAGAVAVLDGADHTDGANGKLPVLGEGTSAS